MQDYLCDFRQRLDRRADALSGRVREKTWASQTREVRVMDQRVGRDACLCVQRSAASQRACNL